MIVEAKNEAGKADLALREAIEYADAINGAGKYTVKVVVGAAGEEHHGFDVRVRFLKNGKWVPLTARKYTLSTIPSKREIELALRADDATTEVSVPSVTEFIDSAIELSSILRHAKVEAPLRPRVIGAIVLALYQGDIKALDPTLGQINRLVKEAIEESVDLDSAKKKKLTEALRLSGSDYERLSPQIGRIVSLLYRLNIRSVLQTDTDFLGLFYEAFLRYGYDNNALGIVFTPRHITRFCADLVNLSVSDRVVDVACGTGGFLVAAFDRMLACAQTTKERGKVKKSLFGFDTNPTIWALAALNMFFRGDGKTHIENADCFATKNRKSVEQKFTRAFLNPPFSQEGEPERDFIDASMDALEPGGTLAVVVKAGIFADEDNSAWRDRFTRNHAVKAVISLPEDLFYPTAAPTSILIAEAHKPQRENSLVLMGRVWNDGFEKLKGKRVECAGSQLNEVAGAYKEFAKGSTPSSSLVKPISAESIFKGREWSPQQYLDNLISPEEAHRSLRRNAVMELYKAVVTMPEVASEALEDFGSPWSSLEPFPLGHTAAVDYFFNVTNGNSQGEKNYTPGGYPYISSGDATNSIVRLVDAEEDEVFKNGGITVTAFGQACIQPWPFVARGNGGSAVRILTPKFSMSLNELLWFVCQINYQRWRFFYGRMAIKSRLERLEISSPQERLSDQDGSLRNRLDNFSDVLSSLSNEG